VSAVGEKQVFGSEERLKGKGSQTVAFARQGVFLLLFFSIGW